jgi:hypothetical protein
MSTGAHRSARGVQLRVTGVEMACQGVLFHVAGVGSHRPLVF